jgi:hypothetical protein
MSLCVLIFYVSTARVVRTVSIRAPDLDRYNQLYDEHPQTLTCPCTKISINYGTFLHVDYSLHPVCSSVFVTDNFISQIPIINTDYVNPIHYFISIDDLRITGASTFQAIRSLCQLAQDSISINIEQFDSISYVNNMATPTLLFQSQSDALIQQFISSMTKTFLLSLRLVRNTTQANALLSTLFTNYKFWFPQDYHVMAEAMQYTDGCHCDTTSTCITQTVLYPDSSISSRWVIPGLYSGCFILEALLQSNFQCFFDQSCVDLLRSYLHLNSTLITAALDPSLNTRYHSNTSIGDIVDQLMVEKWNWSAVHDDYYAACKPNECTYTVTGGNDAIYIITTVIGLIGGMVAALKLMVPQLVWVITRLKKENRPSAGKCLKINEGD